MRVCVCVRASPFNKTTSGAECSRHVAICFPHLFFVACLKMLSGCNDKKLQVCIQIVNKHQLRHDGCSAGMMRNCDFKK